LATLLTFATPTVRLWGIHCARVYCTSESRRGPKTQFTITARTDNLFSSSNK